MDTYAIYRVENAYVVAILNLDGDGQMRHYVKSNYMKEPEGAGKILATYINKTDLNKKEFKSTLRHLVV